MKYLAGIGLGEKGTFDSSAGTLTFTGSVADFTIDQVILVVNTTKNIVLHNNNNPDLEGSWASGVMTFNIDTYVAADNASGDEIHTWLEVPNGVSGVDFLSELALKDMSYAAMNGVELNATTANFNADMSTTEANTANTVTQLTLAVAELTAQTAHLAKLVEIPDTEIIDNVGSNAAATKDVTDYTPNPEMFVSVRSLTEDTFVTLRNEDPSNPGTYDQDILSNYELDKDDFLDIKFDAIEVSIGGKVIITLLSA